MTEAQGPFGALDHLFFFDNLLSALGDRSHCGNGSDAARICVPVCPCACVRCGSLGKEDDSHLALLYFSFRQLALMHVGPRGRLGISICCLGEFASVGSGDQSAPIKGLSAGAGGRGRHVEQGQGISIGLGTGRHPEVVGRLSSSISSIQFITCEVYR